MKTILVWYLVSFGTNSALHWSPPLPSLQECQRIQAVYIQQRKYSSGRVCIQINEVVK